MPSPSAHRVWPLLALLAWPTLVRGVEEQEEDPKPDGTAPGVVARFEDAGRGVSIEMIEPLPRLFGRAGDSPHPKIAADRFRARWSGLLVIPRDGAYTFTAARSSLANLRITIGGKPAPLGEVVALEAGSFPLRIEGRQAGGEPAFELWWRGDDFADEPIPARVFRHEPLAATAEANRQRLDDRGAILADTFGCFRCHEAPGGWGRSLTRDPAAVSSLLPGPNLDGLGARVRKAWVLGLLTGSQRRPGSRMPVLFGNGPEEALAARAIAVFLTNGDVPEANDRRGDAKAGEATYKAAGCAACHAPGREAEAADSELTSEVPKLDHLSSKWKRGGLADFLREPLVTRPHGRMPDAGLSPNQAEDLAAFLLADNLADAPAEADTPRAIAPADLAGLWNGLGGEPAALDQIPEPQRLATVALRLMADRQCLSCHEVHSDGLARVDRRDFGLPAITLDVPRGQVPAPPPALRDLSVDQANRGCLEDGGNPKGKAPRFDLSRDERNALRAYATSLRGDSAPSSAAALRIELATLNCVRCHTNEGAGGSALTVALGGGDQARLDSPPTLTGAGDRVGQGRLAHWLSAGARQEALHPWVPARMPGYGLRGGHLAEDLGRRDGAVGGPLNVGATAPVLRQPELRPDQGQLGRFLAGSKGLGCVNCHSFRGTYLAGKPEPVTRGPDLTLVGEHLRPEYFQRWMMDPARIRPDTKMPKALLADGGVPIPSMSTLPPGTPLAALWAYLNQGERALPPAEEPSVLPSPKPDGPLVQRGDPTTEGAERIPKGLALGFADGTLLFDADRLAPVALWHGGFVKGGDGPYFGMNWTRVGGASTSFPVRPEAIAFQLAPGDPWSPSPLPLESDLNAGSRFQGYRIGKTAVRLRYRLLAGTQPVSVTDDLRVESRDSWQGFARVLRFTGLPEGARTALLVPEGESFAARSANGEVLPGGVVATTAPLLTYRNGPAFRAVRVSAPAESSWEGLPAAGEGEARPRLVLPRAKPDHPVEVEIDWWSYRGPEPGPTPQELATLTRNPPAFLDRFDEPIEARPAEAPAVAVAQAQIADAPKPPASPRIVGRPPLTHQRNVDEFPPALAKSVRFRFSATDGNPAALDEFEIFGDPPEVNLARAGVASASSTIANDPIHKVEHLNDGKYGNAFSWVAATGGDGWVRIDLPEKVAVRKVVWGRDRTGGQKDRLAVKYRIEVSPDGSSWTEVSDQSTRETLRRDVSPGFEMEAIPLPFAGCRPSDVAFGPRADADADGVIYAVAMTEGQVYRSPIPPPDRPDAVRWSRFAGGLNHPIGIAVVEGRVFVAQKPEITELIDRDGDGVADEYRTVATGWGLSKEGWHEYCFGLADDRAGHLYFALTTGRFWTHLGHYVFPGRLRGSIMRVGVSDGVVEVVANGCRVPNGVTRGPDHAIFFTDNQGDWIQSCKLAKVVEGRFYGHPETVADALPADTFPTGLSSVWLPYLHTRSASGPVHDDTGGKFGPFAGQFFVGDAGYGANPGLVRVAFEEVEGETQGAVFRFAEDEPHGVERLKFGPDGRLYLASLTTGLTRLRFTGATPFAFQTMTIRPGGVGFVLRLTKPLAADLVPQPADFRVKRYHFLYKGDYGSPQADEAAVPVESVELSADRTAITLSLPVETYPIGMVYELAASRLKSADGEALRHNEAWYTVHRIPKAR